MGNRSVGQAALAMAVSVSLLFGGAVAAFQLAGLGLRNFQVQEAAAAGARTMAHGLRVGDPRVTPCWQAVDGLLRPAAYSEAEVCRAVVANLGALDPHYASVAVAEGPRDASGQPSSYEVTISYREPVTSPVLRLFVGSAVTTTGQATATGN